MTNLLDIKNQMFFKIQKSKIEPLITCFENKIICLQCWYCIKSIKIFKITLITNVINLIFIQKYL